MNINCMDYMYEAHDTGISVEEVESLYVQVISGDEIVTVHKTDGSEETFDASDFTENYRWMDFNDGDYGVHKDDLQEWLKRRSTYEWFGRDEEDAEV